MGETVEALVEAGKANAGPPRRPRHPPPAADQNPGTTPY
jgi:hypothetical protein